MDLPIPDTWAEAAPHVLPVLRGPTSPANAWEAALDRAEAAGVRAPFAPMLDLVAVLDLPEVRLFLNRGHLDAWDVPDEVVLATAIGNLPTDAGLHPWEGADGVWSCDGDSYASSRLALPGFLGAFADDVRGDPVAVVPTAGTLLVSGTDAGLPLQAMLTAAYDAFHGGGTPVSCAPYTLADGRVVPWSPGPDHPLVHRVDLCHRMQAGHAYRRQHGPLEAWLTARGVPDWLAPYSLIRHRSGRVVSVAAWPDGPTLLPRVDLVALAAPGPDLLDAGPVLPWDALVDLGLIGEPETALAPPRHRVGRHPADLADVRARAVDPRSWSRHGPGVG